MSSRVMNPAAAQALYGGDLDAALAYNAGQPQYAAGGGLMEMNPVMGNDGKFTEMQTGINDAGVQHLAGEEAHPRPALPRERRRL